MAALDIGAKRRQEWLYDIYQMGRDAIRNNARETFVIPADQWDPGTAVKLINVLRLGGIEIERATAPFSAGGKQYGAGSISMRSEEHTSQLHSHFNLVCPLLLHKNKTLSFPLPPC